jgi:outer membrane protein TolC
MSVQQLDGVLDGATDAERSLAEQFRLGAMTYLAYIDGLSRLDATRSTAIETRLELLFAHVDLFDLLGDLAPLSLTAPMEATR